MSIEINMTIVGMNQVRENLAPKMKLTSMKRVINEHFSESMPELWV